MSRDDVSPRPGEPEPGPEVIPGEVVGAEPTVAEAGGEPEPWPAVGGEGAMDFGAMMQMAQDMSERMGSAHAELAEARAEGTAGGGVVKVVLNGHLHLLEVVVDPAAVDPDDPSVVGDLVVAAWRDAHDEVARLQAAADPLGGLGAALGGDLGGLLGGG
ncbi:MAG: YbaB/EbfC family nucleoid-associated protein [Microthrixaceae bacterium]|nr:YbaB/EbfC family nucleoid-associated protein [Microthrixaceae bacterium]